MATKTNPLKPLIFKFNAVTVEAVDNQSWYAQSGRYYFYSVYFANWNNYGSPVFTGKTWCYDNEYNSPEITVDIADIVESYMYDSWHLLKPEYNIENQKNELFYLGNGSTVKPICCNKSIYSKHGFGRTVVMVYIHANADEIPGGGSSALCYLRREVTSSWNIRAEVKGPTDTYVIQDLLDLQYPHFISHYPKAMTDELSISYLVNYNGLTTTGVNVYFGNNGTDNIRIGVERDDTLYTEYTGGYLPFNIRLSDLIPTLHEIYSPAVPFVQIIGGNSSMQIQNTFTTGTSVEYEPNNTWIGGNAQPHAADVPEVNETNKIFYWSVTNTSTPGLRAVSPKVQIAVLDECYSKYYLKWQTKSLVPVCCGFDGNTVVTENFDTMNMQNKYRTERLKTNKMKTSWELKSGIVDKTTYDVFCDIFTSPYVILYDTQTDKSYFVTVDDNSHRKYFNVKAEKMPRNFTINITEAEQTKIIY